MFYFTAVLPKLAAPKHPVQEPSEWLQQECTQSWFKFIRILIAGFPVYRKFWNSKLAFLWKWKTSVEGFSSYVVSQ